MLDIFLDALITILLLCSVSFCKTLFSFLNLSSNVGRLIRLLDWGDKGEPRDLFDERLLVDFLLRIRPVIAFELSVELSVCVCLSLSFELSMELSVCVCLSLSFELSVESSSFWIALFTISCHKSALAFCVVLE